jgi:hypothetical protein
MEDRQEFPLNVVLNKLTYLRYKKFRHVVTDFNQRNMPRLYGFVSGGRREPALRFDGVLFARRREDLDGKRRRLQVDPLNWFRYVDLSQKTDLLELADFERRQLTAFAEGLVSDYSFQVRPVEYKERDVRRLTVVSFEYVPRYRVVEQRRLCV